MDFSSNIDLIIRDLTEVCEIIDDLKQYPGVPAFQVEIAKSKCRGAAELIALLKSYREKEPVLTEIKKSPHVVPEAKPAEIKKLEKIAEEHPEATGKSVFELSDEQAEDINIEKARTETVKTGQRTNKIKAAEPDENNGLTVIKEILQDASEKKEPGKNVDKTSGQAIIADRFSNTSNSLYEQIGKSADNDVVPELILAKPVTSLTEAIGLNDRFLLIGELFKGDKEAYLQAISKLDNTETYTEARSIALGLADGNEDSEAIRHLLMIIKRKHPSNE